MSAAQIAFGAVVGLLLAMSLSQLWMAIASRRSVGKPAPSVGVDLGEGSSLLYFTSPTCGPCRAMTPRIDAISAKGARVVKIDVTARPEVAAAYGVMATPTTIAVRGGQIREVKLGVLSVDALAAMLAT